MKVGEHAGFGSWPDPLLKRVLTLCAGESTGVAAPAAVLCGLPDGGTGCWLGLVGLVPPEADGAAASSLVATTPAIVIW